MRTLKLLSILLIAGYSGISQTPDLKILAKLPPVLDETSALVLTPKGNLWTVVDSKYAMLYNIDTTGAIKKTVRLNHKNQDWEELAQDADGNFYIGAFGNNKSMRKNLRIYKIPSPDAITDTIVTGQLIKFTYSDQKSFPPPPTQQNFDMEAMVCFQNSIYLFSKNRTNPFTGYTKMYKLPNTPGEYVAELIDSVNLGPGTMVETWVTAADLSPDNKILALLSSDKVFLFYCFTGDKFFSGKKKVVLLNNMSQKEGLCFINNRELFISDELTYKILGGNLYHFKLPKDFATECKK